MADKADSPFNVLKALVEAGGGSIEPFRRLLQDRHDDTVTSGLLEQLEPLVYTAIGGLFHCAARGTVFCALDRIEQFYGRTLEDAYPGVSLTFMKLARTYWTLKIVIIDNLPAVSPCSSLLATIDMNFAGVFFPTPGPFGPPASERVRAMRVLIEQSGADFDVEDYLRGNPYI